AGEVRRGVGPRARGGGTVRAARAVRDGVRAADAGGGIPRPRRDGAPDRAPDGDGRVHAVGRGRGGRAEVRARGGDAADRRVRRVGGVPQLGRRHGEAGAAGIAAGRAAGGTPAVRGQGGRYGAAAEAAAAA